MEEKFGIPMQPFDVVISRDGQPAGGTARLVSTARPDIEAG